MLALALLSFIAALAADPSSRVQSMTLSEPRAFGYFLGDVIGRDITLTLKPGAHVEAASLPRPGAVNYWLELRSVDTDERSAGGGTRVTIALKYQAFYSALDPRKLTIPGFTLTIADASGSENILVPEWSFLMSPLRELFPGKETEGTAVSLRPDATSRLLPTSTQRTALIVAGVVTLATLILLAMHYAWGPFRRRPGRPFTQAARFLKGNGPELTGDGGYRAALLKLHRAFDETAGRRVLPDDLSGFLAEHPQFAPLSRDIERLFASSRAAFYSNDVAHARAGMPIAAIAELGARLGAVERRAT